MAKTPGTNRSETAVNEMQCHGRSSRRACGPQSAAVCGEHELDELHYDNHNCNLRMPDQALTSASTQAATRCRVSVGNISAMHWVTSWTTSIENQKNTHS